MLLKEAHRKSANRNPILINVQGSKHSFSRVFPSFLQLDSGLLRNVPVIKDVEIQIEIMQTLGFLLDFDKGSNVLKYSGRENNHTDMFHIGDYPSKFSRSLINLYPIFSRFDVELKEPAGCPIGRRDISWYVDIMRRFGICVDQKGMQTRVYRSKLNTVSEIPIRDRSFSSTNITITCAIESKSKLKISGPSIEPEILDLIGMLKQANMPIQYHPEEDCIRIDAEKSNESMKVDYTILPDRNVIVTVICGALLLKRDIKINLYGFTMEMLQLEPFLHVLRQLDIEVAYMDGEMAVKGSRCRLKGKEIEIRAGHHPLFSSDWQPLVAVLSILGVSMTIEDTLFESRFGYLEEYRKFGVKYRMINERKAKIIDSEGVHLDPDEKINATARDLRCGAGAGLLSMLHEGVCEIHNVVQIERGYEKFDQQLNTLMGNNLFRYV